MRVILETLHQQSDTLAFAVCQLGRYCRHFHFHFLFLCRGLCGEMTFFLRFLIWQMPCFRFQELSYLLPSQQQGLLRLVRSMFCGSFLRAYHSPMLYLRCFTTSATNIGES